MISYQPAGNEHFDELLEIIYHQISPYSKPILDLNQISWNKFGRRFRTSGRVYRILVDGCLAGLCWVEVCSRVLRLHGLVVKPAYQGQGVGTQTLAWLEDHFLRDVDGFELIVHASNPRTKALYERHGYQTIRPADPPGFYTPRKLRNPRSVKDDQIMDIPIGKVTHFYQPPGRGRHPVDGRNQAWGYDLHSGTSYGARAAREFVGN